MPPGKKQFTAQQIHKTSGFLHVVHRKGESVRVNPSAVKTVASRPSGTNATCTWRHFLLWRNFCSASGLASAQTAVWLWSEIGDNRCIAHAASTLFGSRWMSYLLLLAAPQQAAQQLRAPRSAPRCLSAAQNAAELSRQARAENTEGVRLRVTRLFPLAHVLQAGQHLRVSQPHKAQDRAPRLDRLDDLHQKAQTLQRCIKTCDSGQKGIRGPWQARLATLGMPQGLKMSSSRNGQRAVGDLVHIRTRDFSPWRTGCMRARSVWWRNRSPSSAAAPAARRWSCCAVKEQTCR